MSPNFDKVMLARMKKHFGCERVLWFDIETFSEAILPDVGAAVYAEDPSTEIFLLGYTFDNDPVKRWDAYETGVWSDKFPPDFIRALTDPKVLKVAWNAAFEHFSFLFAAGIEIPLDQMIDGMIAAYYLSFPGKLDKAGELVGLSSDQAKDKAGKALIRKFSMPVKPTKRNGGATRIWPWDDPADWKKYADYNAQDVNAMRNVMYRLMQFPMPLDEWENWRMDTAMNLRGIPINKKMATNAARLFDEFQERLMVRLKAITGLDNPNSNTQMLSWLKASGEYPFDNMRKGSVARSLLLEHLRPKNELVIEALELKRQLSQTSAKKYHKLAETVNSDGTSKGALQFYGAQRTGRVGGRLWQPQNMKKPDDDIAVNMPAAATIIETATLDELIAVANLGFGKEPMDFLSQSVRGAVQAPPGGIFLDSDLSAIENVGVGWLSDEQKILEVFRKGLDPYLSFAVHMFKQPYEELQHELKVLKKKKKRTTAKPAVLGCFQSDTKVLTNRGWVRIAEVSCNDLVADGEEWVTTDGAVFMGVKKTILFGGVRVTPEHRILVDDEWTRADATTSHAAAVSAGRILQMQNKTTYPKDSREWVCTFDLLNCGPRNRFVVLTEDGPVIAHNCGYRLGAGQRYIDEDSGEEEATGLIGYGKAMGIDLTDEEARESVSVWRETYSRVVEHWRELEVAAMYTLATGRPQKAGKVTYHLQAPFLCCRLPSGRDLFYYKAHVRKVMAPWGDYVDNIAYYGLKEGQWCLQTTHGGKLLENNTQTWARDVLYYGLRLAAQKGIDIRMHIHDQGVALARADRAKEQLAILRACMGTPPPWGLDIPLSTGAITSTHFSKD